MHAAKDGTGEVQHLLSSTTFHPRLPGTEPPFATEPACILPRIEGWPPQA